MSRLRGWNGEGGIRTLERGHPRYAISSRARSAAPAPLRIRAAGCERVRRLASGRGAPLHLSPDRRYASPVRALFFNEGNLDTHVLGHGQLDAALRSACQGTPDVDAALRRALAAMGRYDSSASPASACSAQAELDPLVLRWHFVQSVRARRALARGARALAGRRRAPLHAGGRAGAGAASCAPRRSCCRSTRRSRLVVDAAWRARGASPQLDRAEPGARAARAAPRRAGAGAHRLGAPAAEREGPACAWSSTIRGSTSSATGRRRVARASVRACCSSAGASPRRAARTCSPRSMRARRRAGARPRHARPGARAPRRARAPADRGDPRCSTSAAGRRPACRRMGTPRHGPCWRRWRVGRRSSRPTSAASPTCWPAARRACSSRTGIAALCARRCSGSHATPSAAGIVRRRRTPARQGALRREAAVPGARRGHLREAVATHRAAHGGPSRRLQAAFR